jgi:hypothetical protein
MTISFFVPEALDEHVRLLCILFLIFLSSHCNFLSTHWVVGVYKPGKDGRVPGSAGQRHVGLPGFLLFLLYILLRPPRGGFGQALDAVCEVPSYIAFT